METVIQILNEILVSKEQEISLIDISDNSIKPLSKYFLLSKEIVDFKKAIKILKKYSLE